VNVFLVAAHPGHPG